MVQPQQSHRPPLRSVLEAYANITTATYTAKAGERVIGVNRAGAVTVTLPSAEVRKGRIYTVKDESGAAASNNITVATEGSETIDGSATDVISVNYESKSYYSDGTNWFILPASPNTQLTLATTVSTQAHGDSAAAGSASTASKGDHKHAMPAAGAPTYEVPGLSLGTSNVEGTGNSIRSGATILAFDATDPSTQAHGDAATAGSATVAARRDHKHAMPASGGPTVIHKPSDETVNNSATLQNDDDFSFAIGANETWIVYMSLRMSMWSAADIDMTWTLPSGGDMSMSATMGIIVPGSFVDGDEVTTPGTELFLDAASDTGHWAIVRATLRNGATGGTAQFQWAQNSAQANNLTIKQDSYIIAIKE